jgi:CRISPR-associated protein Csx17
MRAEIWLPLWSRFTGYTEVSHVFREGRVQFSRRRDRAVRTGFDFARAVAELGVDRGIDAFQRYGFIERNGQANLAAPLGRFDIPKGERTRAALIHELDRWLDRLSRATSDTKRTPPRLIRVREQIEEAIFDLCASGEPERLRATLLALGEAEAELARGPRFREEHGLQPLSGLSADWERACDDVTPEFEVAAALASIGGERGRWAFRTSLEPVEVSGPAVNWTTDDASAVWGAGTLAENLAAVLHRRSVDARRDGLSHPVMDDRRVASLHAVGSFLSGASLSSGLDDERTEALLRGLALIDWHNAARRTAGTGAEDAPELPRAYALLKLLFLPEGKFVREPGGEPILLKHEPSVVPLLRAGNVREALRVATRRLVSSGLTPFKTEFYYPDDEGVRLAAALLIPISERDVRELANMVLRSPASAE